MIKRHSFKFSKVCGDNPWVEFAHFGELLEDEEELYVDYRDCKFALDPEQIYQFGFDQSSSNTGIFIKNLTNTEVHMIEVKRKRESGREQTAEDYLWDLEMFLHQIAEGCTISHLVYERPINTTAYRSAQVLFQLEGVIKTLPKRYHEFSTACTDNIENESWRSAVCDKSKKDLYSRKELSKWSLIHTFPWLDLYGPSLYKDNDIYEAVGVLFGWFVVSFDPLGRPYVRGDRTSRTIGGYVLPGIPAEKVKEMLHEYDIESSVLIENPNYSVYKNLAAAVKQYKTVCVEFTSKYTMLCLSIECNIKWMEPDVMTAILVDASTVDTRLDKLTGGTFHFVL